MGTLRRCLLLPLLSFEINFEIFQVHDDGTDCTLGHAMVFSLTVHAEMARYPSPWTSKERKGFFGTLPLKFATNAKRESALAPPIVRHVIHPSPERSTTEGCLHGFTVQQLQLLQRRLQLHIMYVMHPGASSEQSNVCLRRRINELSVLPYPRIFLQFL